VDDVTPVGAVGLTSLLGGIIAVIWRFLGTRTDPQLIELMREQNEMIIDGIIGG
jgi:hypothetical protein